MYDVIWLSHSIDRNASPKSHCLNYYVTTAKSLADPKLSESVRLLKDIVRDIHTRVDPINFALAYL